MTGEGTAAALAPIEKHLDDSTARLALPPSLIEAIRYALLGGGKRLRPLLAWHACIAAGGTGEASLFAGGAVELIHAFSLVHDDLPSLDNDDLRRGQPTLHLHAGEPMAILAGDAMMALAFDHLTPDAAGCSATLSARLVRELSAATTAMIAGQVYDSLGGFTPGLDGRQKLDLIHRNKTAALIRAACRMGAMCADPDGAAPASLGALTAYGEATGLIFQIVDDLLDVEGSPEATGKPTGRDAPAGRLTYPGLIGVEGSRREIARLQEAALAAISPLGPSAEPLSELCRFMAHRGR